MRNLKDLLKTSDSLKDYLMFLFQKIDDGDLGCIDEAINIEACLIGAGTLEIENAVYYGGDNQRDMTHFNRVVSKYISTVDHEFFSEKTLNEMASSQYRMTESKHIPESKLYHP